MARPHKAFDVIYDRDHLAFFQGDELQTRNVVDFLGLTNTDVSKIAKVSKATVRYDERIPSEVYERLLEIANLCNLVAEFFPREPHKVKLWFTTPNPQFGNISPRDMIRFGRYNKLRQFVLDAREEARGSKA